jgi:hypothetical protein
MYDTIHLVIHKMAYAGLYAPEISHPFLVDLDLDEP